MSIQNDNEIANEVVTESMNESIHTESNEVPTTGYSEIDKILMGGHKQGTYSIIAARTGVGKSVFMKSGN